MEGAAAAVADVATVAVDRAVVAGGGDAGRIALAKPGSGVADLVGGAVAAAVEGAAAVVAHVAAEVEGRTVGARGDLLASRIPDAQVILAGPARRAGLAAIEGAATAVADLAAVLPALGIAGERRTGGRHALVVPADLAGDTVATDTAAAAPVADGAAVFAGAGSARDGHARGATLAQVILTGPTGRRAVSASDRGAAAVTEQATAVLSARGIAGRRHAARRGHALVVLADLVGRASPAVLGVAAAVADGAAILAGSASTRRRNTRRTAGA